MVRRFGSRLIAVAVAIGLATVVGAAGVLADSWRLTAISLLALMALLGILLLDSHRRQTIVMRRTAAAHSAAQRLSRDVANVSERLVTETQRLERLLRAGRRE